MPNHRHCLSRLLLFGALLGSLASPPARAAPPAEGGTFPETGQTLSGAFWQYWQAHGGLAQQGYPISPPLRERSPLDGRTYTVQYCERAVLEAHPENAPPYEVLGVQLGTFRYRARYPAGAPGQHPAPGGTFFPPTEHTVGGAFLAYWQSHGGLAQQGYPLSDEFTEVSDLDGRPYTVQYFERAIFEAHPENAPPYDVLLAQLGTFRYHSQYPAGVPPTTTPAGPFAADRFGVQTTTEVTPAFAAAMKGTGAQLVRYILQWSVVQPAADTPLDWSRIDASLQALAGAGLDVLVEVGGNPTWAASTLAGPIDRAAPERFYAFLAAGAARYRGLPYTVRGWEIFNEPDGTDAWGGQPAGYAALLQRASAAIKAAAPATAVVMGGLAYDYFTDQGGIYVRNWLPQFLAAGGGTATDALNFHHYSSSNWSSFGAAVTSLRAALAAAGLAKPLIWTEAGAPSDLARGGTPGSQAAYVAKFFAQARAWGVESLTWFPFRDFTYPRWIAFGSHGLVGLDDTPKPAYTAYQVAARVFAGATLARLETPGEFTAAAPGEGYVFARPDGSAFAVAWTAHGPGTQSWPAAQVRAVHNVFGAAVAYPVAGGQAVIPLSASPVYVELAGP